MPVEKLDGAVLRKLDTGYDVVCRASIETLKTGEALALFIVMATRPANWIFNKSWLMARTGFGEDRYKRGMDELKAGGFVTVATVRTDSGSLSGRVIWFSQNATEIPENRTSAEIPVSRTSGFPELRENTTLKEERESLKKKESRHFVPPSLEEVESYVMEKSLNVDAAHFLAYFEVSGWRDSTGKKVKNWKQKVLTWHRHSKQPVQSAYGRGAI